MCVYVYVCVCVCVCTSTAVLVELVVDSVNLLLEVVIVIKVMSKETL